MSNQPSLSLPLLRSFTFGQKTAQPEIDPSVPKRLARLRNEYKNRGMRRTVEAVMLVSDKGAPHLLSTQIGGSFFKLPGDTLEVGEDAIQGMQRILDMQLSPDSKQTRQWDVGECLSVWWRPNFTQTMYPYTPAHIKRPKEEKLIFLVHLPSKGVFSVPKNMKLLAVPLFELYENAARYGPIISSIPHLIARFVISYQEPPEFKELEHNENIAQVGTDGHNENSQKMGGDQQAKPESAQDHAKVTEENLESADMVTDIPANDQAEDAAT